MDAVAARMSAAQFAEWQEFAGVEPFGEEEEWLRTGMICSTVANANPFRGNGSPAKVTDYIRKPPPSPELLEQLAKAQAFASKANRESRPNMIRSANKKPPGSIRLTKLPPPQPKEATHVPVNRPRNRRQRPN